MRAVALVALLPLAAALVAPSGPAPTPAVAAARVAAPAAGQPGPPGYAGYLFAYFTGEGIPDGEQVRFALSEGDDPLRWRELNAGAPVLTSTVGDRGVRDPFVVRSPAGDRFYLIATDLRMYGDGNWDAAQRAGSRSIVVWESTDLVGWSDPWLAPVAPATAGNVWAPEAVYDAALGRYVVFWASKIYAENDPGHAGNTHQRMMYATTTDFRTFSEPAVWHDPGYSVIDSTVITHGGTYYRFTKDERANSPTAPCGKFITVEKSADLLTRAWQPVAECVGSGAMAHGEGPIVVKSNTEDRWYLFIDEFGGRGYLPFESTELDSGTWRPSAAHNMPARPRHGSVLPVTGAEYDRLQAAYGG